MVKSITIILVILVVFTLFCGCSHKGAVSEESDLSAAWVGVRAVYKDYLDTLALENAAQTFSDRGYEVDDNSARDYKYGNADGFEYEEGDVELLARIIYAEARGESYLGQLMVGNNIINRCLDTYYPDTIKTNIYRSGQYTPVRNGKLTKAYNKSTLRAAEDLLINGVRVLPYWCINFQVANKKAFRYARVGNHTHNYRIHTKNLWRIWVDPVEEPQYFIDRLNNAQIRIALESMPSYYTFDRETKTVSYKSLDSSPETILATKIQIKENEIETLSDELAMMESRIETQESVVKALHEDLRQAETNRNIIILCLSLLCVFAGIVYVIDKNKQIAFRRSIQQNK